MRYLILTSFVLYSMYCHAQDSKKLRYFEVGLGTNHISVQDQVFSPLVYRGSGFLFDVSYYNQKKRRAHDINIAISSQELTPKLNSQGSGRVENTNFYLNYEYLRSLSANGKHNLGIGFYNFASVRNYIFLVEDDISFDVFSSINVAYAFQHSLKEKHHFTLKASLPITAYVIGRMRVPNDFSEDVFQSIVEDPNVTPTGEILTSGDFLTFDEFLDIRLRLEYLYDFSERIGVGFTYFFQYYTYPKFETVDYGTSQYIFRMAYKF